MRWNCRASVRTLWCAACAFGAAACASAPLILPERDLARELLPQTEALKDKAEDYCRSRALQVARVELRLTRGEAGERVTMDATCDADDARFECTLISPNAGNEEYNCASIPP